VRSLNMVFIAVPTRFPMVRIRAINIVMRSISVPFFTNDFFISA